MFLLVGTYLQYQEERTDSCAEFDQSWIVNVPFSLNNCYTNDLPLNCKNYNGNSMLCHLNLIVLKLEDNAYFCRIGLAVSAQLVARRRFFNLVPTYVSIAQSGRECKIFKCVTAILLCPLQGILSILALLAYIHTLAVQTKRTSTSRSFT